MYFIDSKYLDVLRPVNQYGYIRAKFIDSVRVHVADVYLWTIIKNWIMCVHVTIYQYQNIIDILPLLDTLRKYIYYVI